MKLPEAYKLADRTLAVLTKRAVQRTARVKKRLLVDNFDELNVMTEVDSLYEGLDSDNRQQFRKLFIARYIEMLLYLMEDKSKVPDEDEIDDLVDMYLAGLLSEPNEVTHFTYDTEVYRKRDRAKEAILAAPGRIKKQIELDKALRIWNRQTTWYVDLVSDEANVQAMKYAGVKHVEWVTQGDKKVCVDCKNRNGRIYPIDKRPNKIHPNCRCYFRRVD
jgi:SPP1 gp7 family putative phage head morphogenesis protein